MNVQVIMRDGQAEYAVIPWSDYQALLAAAEPIAASPYTLNTAMDWQALRESAGLSVPALARAAGISPTYLELIEKGERQASEAIQQSLRRALGAGGGS